MTMAALTPPVRQLQRFLHDEAAGGLVLIAAALLAIVWSNSPWRDAYHELWATRLVFDIAFVRVEEDLRHLVNDGAMTVFFFVVGLEIKRELLRGELANRATASLPIAAAFGGMLVPAAIYLIVNAGEPAAHGWGIPMATDIAFALGVMALAGPSVPTSLKVFLLALAIVDDLGAILVIAVFYTEEIAIEPLVIASAIVLSIVAARAAGIRSILFYVLPGAVLWLAVLESGIHATIAGVVLALLTPAGPVRKRDDYHGGLRRLATALTAADARGDSEEADALTAEIGALTSEREPPLDQLERGLHPWATFLIVPLFALANAGLELAPSVLSAPFTSPVGLGVLLGLVVGKPAGILLFSWLSVRVGLAARPKGVGWSHLAAAGCLGGIGFTVSLFVTGLAFDLPSDAADATAGIFLASLTAATMGFLLLRRLPHSVNGS